MKLRTARPTVEASPLLHQLITVLKKNFSELKYAKRIVRKLSRQASVARPLRFFNSVSGRHLSPISSVETTHVEPPASSNGSILPGSGTGNTVRTVATFLQRGSAQNARGTALARDY